MIQQAEQTKTTLEQHVEPKKKNKAFLIVLIALVVTGGSFGLVKYNHAQHHEETDDAQIEANISPVIPRIGGYVMEIRVRDNQKVKKGDTLVILDNRSELIQLEQAEAALKAAQSNLSVANAATTASRASISAYEANVSTAAAQIEAAKVTLRRATQDYERYSNLIKDHSITLQQFEQAEAAKLSAERQLQVLMGQEKAATRQTHAAASQSNTTAQQVNVVNASIQQRLADIENVKLNLSYTVITAPQDGIVSKVPIQIGQLLVPGQMLFSIVSDTDTWVVANFKETQLEKMQAGQKVTVHIDAYPGIEFEGKVTSFSPATGARFSLLPPDNASGNFVKVVQRVPVKVELVSIPKTAHTLRPGMNAAVDVHLN
jgi:membrane fusion protein (multidrug efflux system)